MPDGQPQQPANKDQPAQEPPQSAGVGSRPADGTVTPGASSPAEAALNGDAQPGWLDDEEELGGLVLVPGSEPVPAERLLIAEPAGLGGGVGGGLCWSFGVDLDAILAAAAKATPGPGGMGLLPGMSAAGRGSMPARDQAPGAAASPGSPVPGPGQAPGDASPDSGDASPDPAGGSPGPGGVLLPDEGGLGLDVVAEYLPGSAGLAAWLDQSDPAGTSDYDLPAVAAGWRRVAAWAQAREFAAIAQIAARSAARNDKTGLEEDGRPSAVTPDAAAQVGLALALSPGTAEWWTGQAVTLTWRLPATGAALAAGEIDAYRARLITEATSLLDEDTARAVENDVLPGAGELTYAQLRARLRRAVIIADPEGAEDRRKAAERRARVSLYPDDEGTATLTGTSLPAPHAAAAMARITALARALKASGAGGGTDLLRAHIYLGLLLGTLPPIPPPADTGQPDEPTDDDQPPPDDDLPPPEDPPRAGPGAAPGDGEQPGHGQHGGSPPGGSQHPGPPRGSRPPRPGQPPSGPPPRSGQPPSGPPPRRDQASRSPAPRRDEVGGRADGDPPSDAPLPSSPRGDGKTRDPDPGTSPPGVRSPRVRPPRPGPCSGSPDPRPPASRPPGPRPPGTDSLGPHPHPRPGPHPPGPEPPAATLPGTNPALATSPSDALPGSGTPSTTPAAPGSTLPAPGTGQSQRARRLPAQGRPRRG